MSETKIIESETPAAVAGAAPCSAVVESANQLLKLVEALKDANDMCRSAYQVAEREAKKFQLPYRDDNTNWIAFRDRLKESLLRQHAVMYPPKRKGQRSGWPKGKR